MKDKDVERHFKEWSEYKELLENYIKIAKEKPQLDWAKERLKSVERLIGTVKIDG